MDEQSAAEKVFAEIGGPHASHEQLVALRRKCKSGELPEKFIETDPKRAHDLYNRMELMQHFVRYRQRIGGLKLRRFVPELALQDIARSPDRTEREPVMRAVPITTGNWLDAKPNSDNQDALDFHAQTRLVQGIISTVQLHGGMRVALGTATPDQVLEDGIVAVQMAVDGLRTGDTGKQGPLDDAAE